MDAFVNDSSNPSEDSHLSSFLLSTEENNSIMLTEDLCSEDVTDKDFPAGLNGLNDLEILNDNVFTNDNMMDCLSDVPPPEESFEISTMDDNDQVLPIYGPFMKYEEPSSYEDVIDASAVPGVCGLRNLGNTCFMNAGLQCLLNNKIFKHYFCDGNLESITSGTLSSKFADIMKKVWSGSYSTLHLTEFKESFGALHIQFRNFRQHDCQEFLALLLDTMHEELNIANKIKLGKLLDDPDYQPPVNFGCDMPENFKGNKDAELEAECSKKLEICSKDVKAKNQKMCNITKCSESFEQAPSNCYQKESACDVVKMEPAANNVKQIKNVPMLITKKNVIEPENIIYEKNTEKMADLLINNANNKIDKILNKNELDVTYNKSKENASKLLEKNHTLLNTNENKLEKNELACKLNSSRKIPSIEDFVKDTKTLNTNVLVEDETNNLYKFDSEKFPKHETNRLQGTVDNLGQIIDFGVKQGGLKRVKMTNLIHEKHKYLENNDLAASCSALNKRLKIENMETSLESPVLESEDAIDMEQLPCDECSEESSQSSELCPINSDSRALSYSEEIRMAYNHWDRYKSLNQSVIVDTFHGQFRSSVVCSQCSHVSITYEPFMYLPVFLPHALERQIVITFVQNNGTSPVRYLVNVNKYERVHKLREALQQLLDVTTEEIALAEVFENHVSRFLDESLPIQRVNDCTRYIYAFEVGKMLEQNSDSSAISLILPEDQSKLKNNDVNVANASNVENAQDCESSPCKDEPGDAISKPTPTFEDSVCESGLVQSGTSENVSSAANSSLSWHSCAICLEELPDQELSLHPSCECILCSNCIEVSCKHYGGDTFICPVCSASVSPTEDFVPINKMGDFKYKVSTIPIPIVMRNDSFEEGLLKDKSLVGHPGLLKLPLSLPAAKLYEHVDNAIPFLSTTYSLLLVDGQGKNCSRCLYNEHCSGCEISRSGDIKLHPGDSLAVRYMDLPQESLDSSSYVAEHKSMEQPRHKTPLDIKDCLAYFSEREKLDEDSPWFCPVCRQNQQATKSLSVWKFPEVLIIYLKRFVFHDCISMKLEDKVSYPLEGLDLRSFCSGPLSGELIYDLQSCVCHYGGLSAGHYTSYSKHAVTNEWHYFNDENVKKETPNTEECVNEYILFYQKR